MVLLGGCASSTRWYTPTEVPGLPADLWEGFEFGSWVRFRGRKRIKLREPRSPIITRMAREGHMDPIKTNLWRESGHFSERLASSGQLAILRTAKNMAFGFDTIKTIGWNMKRHLFKEKPCQRPRREKRNLCGGLPEKRNPAKRSGDCRSSVCRTFTMKLIISLFLRFRWVPCGQKPADE